MNDLKIIEGFLGGGGGGGSAVQPAPVEAPDSLRSRQFASVVDLVSEGTIKGLVNGLKSVYLDGVPIQNADGTNNFDGVTLVSREGADNQTFIPGFEEVENEVNVGIEVTLAVAVTKQISNSNMDRARITLGVPALFKQETNGDIKGTSVAITIELQANGGGYTVIHSDTISGKTTSRYQRTYNVTLAGAAPWDIRVSRVTADNGSITLSNATYWDSYTEIIDTKFAYTKSAYNAVEVSAEQFRNIPTRGYETEGMLIQIPDNYNPITRVYTGSWGGDFDTEYSDNPAWCFYDMIVNDRYGLGKFIVAAQIDKFALYTIAQYCDELVDDGFGGTEPRFTCNLYLQTAAQALDVLTQMASIFRGIVYWSAGSITTSQDAPASAVALFNESNVQDGMFTYTGTSLLARKTVALVTWNDPDDAYRQKIEYVEDQAGIALYGVRETTAIAMGCTSRGQAHRVGKWALWTSRQENEIVTFRTGFEGTTIAPGSIFKTNDQHKAALRNGGRVVAGSSPGNIIVDSAVTIDGTSTYTLHVILPDGTTENQVITNAAGSPTGLTPTVVFSDTPATGSVWALSSSSLALETWRCVSVTEVDGLILEITGLSHVSTKFDEIESDLKFESPPTSLLTSSPITPTGLVATEELYLAAPGVVDNRVTLSWNATLLAVKWRVTYLVDDSNPVSVDGLLTPILDIDNAIAGDYTFTVTAYSSLNFPSVPATLNQTMVADTAAPGIPQNMSMAAAGGTAILRWDLSSELDVSVGGNVIFRHSSLSSGATWADGTAIGDAIAGSETVAVLPLLAGTYMAKFKDAGGRLSATPASAITKAGSVLNFTTLGTISEHTTFTGTHDDTVTIDSVLKLQGSDLMDDWPDVDAVVDWDGGVAGFEADGTYTYSVGFDLGSVKNVRVKKVLKSVVVNAYDKIDSRLTNIDDWPDFDGASGAEADAKVYVRETDDDPAGAPTWSAWAQLDMADFLARGFEFKAELTRTDSNYNIHVSELGATVEEIV